MSCSSRCRGDRGQDMVEYALVLPILLVLLFGIVELGTAIWHYNTVANAAREVARCGAMRANDLDACVQQSVANWGTGLNLTADNFDASRMSRTVRVVLDYDYHPITGYIVPGATLHFQTVATMWVE